MRCYSGIAQSVEHLTVNQGVTGSSPVAGATIVPPKFKMISGDFSIVRLCAVIALPNQKWIS